MENETKTTETYSGVLEEVVDLPMNENCDEDDSTDSQDSAVDYQDFASEDDGEGDVGEDAEEDSEPECAVQETPKQTRSENAAIRAARLRAEREGYTKAEKDMSDDIAKSGIINPYTGKPFESVAEFREYGKKVKRARLEERAKKEGKDISVIEEEEANREYITKMRKAQEEREAPSGNDFIASDVIDFVERYPEFSSPEKLSALENNKSFRAFCGSRFGREPLAELYASYLDITGEAGNAAVAKSTSRAARSTGTGGDGGDMLTPSERKALNEWNEAFPELKMTPKEFKSRK